MEGGAIKGYRRKKGFYGVRTKLEPGQALRGRLGLRFSL